MVIKRALEIEGMALLKCEPTPPPPPPKKKGIFLKVLSNFLNFQFKKKIKTFLTMGPIYGHIFFLE